MTKTAPEIPNKLFYKIGEVCEITDTQPYVLRFWESEFPQLAPRKNRSGQRVYQKKDIETVFRIKKLLYEEEYTIAGARRKLDDEAPADKNSRGSAQEGSPAAERQLVLKEQRTARPGGQEEDHPVDLIAGRSSRTAIDPEADADRHDPREVSPQAAAPTDRERQERLGRALAELKETLREMLAILKRP